MKRVRRRPSAADTARANRVSNDHLHRIAKVTERALRLATDPDYDKRIAAGRCRACYYGLVTKMVGHAFTAWTCRFCTDGGTHHNTGVPVVCRACSVELGLCVECGGHLDDTARDKLQRRPHVA